MQLSLVFISCSSARAVGRRCVWPAAKGDGPGIWGGMDYVPSACTVPSSCSKGAWSLIFQRAVFNFVHSSLNCKIWSPQAPSTYFMVTVWLLDAKYLLKVCTESLTLGLIKHFHEKYRPNFFPEFIFLFFFGKNYEKVCLFRKTLLYLQHGLTVGKGNKLQMCSNYTAST